MPLGKSACLRAWLCPLTLALGCVLAPAAALAAANRPGDGDLSPRLLELAKPSVRAAPPARQARELSLAAEGPGSLLRQGNRVLVEVRFDRGAAAGVDDLRAAGAKIVNVSPRYQTVTVAAKPAELRALSGVPRVAGVTEALTPFTSAFACPAGVAVSEGDTQLRAAEARSVFGVDGTSVTVGILSDSFDLDGTADTSQSDDAASGDLPGTGNPCAEQTTPVDTALDVYDPGPEEPAPGDEGRAMAQIVHDLAPGAQISFATAFTGLIPFAENVEALAAGGAEVIADDVSYFEEPFFQEGPVGVAIGKVTENDDVAYFSSAGNNNLISAGRDIASWEAPAFRDAGSCPVGLPVYATHCMDFNPDEPAVDRTFALKVSAGATLRVDLQWNQPWNGVTTDLDAYLLDSSNKLLTSSENHNATSTKIPFEFAPWKNTTGTAQTVRLAIDRCDSICGGVSGGDAGTPRLKFAILQNGGGVTQSEYPESIGTDRVGPTIFGHNGAEDAMSVGAIRHSATEEPEAFSSRGPVTHYFEPVDGGTPATELLTPLELAKPDVVATDGGADTFFGSCSAHTWRFFGTSAAAPHAAAVAALERQAVPAADAAEVKGAQIATAGAVGAFPATAVGAGIVNATAAIAALKSEPPPAPIEQIQPIAPENCELQEPPTEKGVEEKVAVTNPPPEPPPVDSTPPATSFRKRPTKVIRTTLGNATAVFVFSSSEGGGTFLCNIDQSPWRICPAHLVRRYRVGSHVLRVAARDAAGNVDPTASVYRFRVKRIG